MISLDMNNLKVCQMVEQLEQTLRYKPKKILNDPIKSKEWKPRSNTSIYTIYQIVRQNPDLIKNNNHVKRRVLESIPHAISACCELTHKRWEELEQKIIEANFFIGSDTDTYFGRLSSYIDVLEITNWTEFENFFTEYFSREITLDSKKHNNVKYEKVLCLVSYYLKRNPHILETFLNASRKYIVKTLMRAKQADNDFESFFNYGNPYTSIEECCLAAYISNLQEADKAFEILVLQNLKKFFEVKKNARPGIACTDDMSKIETAFKKIYEYSKKFKEQNWKEINDLADEYVDSLPEFVLQKAIAEGKAFDEIREQKVFEALAQKLVTAREVYATERAIRVRNGGTYYSDVEPERWIDRCNYSLMTMLFNYVEDVVKNRCRVIEFFYISLNAENWLDRYLDLLKDMIRRGVDVDRT